MTRSRIVIISIAAVLALASGGFFNNSTSTPSVPTAQQADKNPPAQPESKEETGPQMKERQFAALIAKSGNFYNCPENTAAKAARDADLLVPCGTETVEIIKKGNTASDVPMIVHAGEGGNNVATSKFGSVLIPENGTTKSRWTVNWTVGEGSTLLQMYALYNCRNGNDLCWAPRYVPGGTQSLVLDDTFVRVALVFTNGKPGFPVPGQWWNKGNEFQNNRQY